MRVRTMSDVEAVLRRRLAGPLPGAPAQQRFAPTPRRPEWAPHLSPPTARHAAALVLVYPGPAGPAVPLTVRHRGLAQHAGQVSLPGGAIEPGESRDAAALREAAEEIGILSDHVRLVGSLSTLWVAVSNFVIHPVVGLADETPAFRLHAGEVEALVEAPLADLLDPEILGSTTRQRGHLEIAYRYFGIGGHEVWGATAMMLAEFVRLFDD